MDFRNVSVSKKMVGAIAIIIVAMAALGLFSLGRLSQVNDELTSLNRDGLPTTVALADLQYSITRYRAFQASFILPISDAERQVHFTTFDKLSRDALDAAKRYHDNADKPREKELAEAIATELADYLALSPTYQEIYKTKGQAEATAYIVGPMRKTFTVLKNSIDEAVVNNSKHVATVVADSHANYVSARLWTIITLAGAVIIAVVLGFWLIRSISNPLGNMTEAMGELASGNLNAHVPHSGQLDEIGKLADAMTSFKNQLAAAERSKEEQTQVIVSSIGTGLAQLAKGDLTHRVTAELTGAFAKLKHDFNDAMGHLQDTMKNILTSTGQISSGAGEISQAADDLSRRTEQQAASLEETAAALEEITATVKKTASNARQARDSVSSAKDAAEQGGHVVGTAIQAMDAISQSSRQITDIIGVIDEIAFQTNLLALNAGVEAARAGEAGKGFAVVATEVRALAGRSSEAAKQIKSLIQASSEQVSAGVRLVGESGTALRAIVDQVQQINSLVSEMAQAAEQQSTGIEEVNSAVSSMDQVTQQNAAMVEESTAASRHLASETKNLEGLVGFFAVGDHMRASARPAERAAPPRVSPKRVAVAGSARRAPAPDGDWAEF